ncbi:MAG: hypothetical protein ABIZ57_09550 [Candidatus Limnocylindria bacterium]
MTADEATLDEVAREVTLLRLGLVRLRELSLDDVAPAFELRLDPEGWI